MPESWMPTTDSEKVVALNNFAVKFPTYATTLGFAAADVTAVQNDYAMLAYVVNLAEVFKAESQERTRYKETLMEGPLGTPAPALPTVPTIAPPAVIVAPGIVARWRALAGRIKAHPAYTRAMGEDLGIEPPSSAPPSPGTLAPKFTAEAGADSTVILKWVKAGQDGVIIESQRVGETVWTKIGMDTSSPYLDSRAPLVAGQPEVRRYRLRYFDEEDSNLIGVWSDIVTVTTIP